MMPSSEKIRSAFMLAAGVGIYLLILVIPPSLPISTAFYRVRLLTLVFLIVVLWLIFRNQGRLWETSGLMAVMGLFAVSLAYKWQSSNYDGSMIGGLLPWQDASGYYQSAQSLLNGLHFSPFGTRRPLFSAFLAALFWVTGRNLQLSVAILVGLNSMCVYIVAQEIRKTFGPFCAAVSAALCYLFYRTWAGTTLTENIGLALGALGLTFLLRGAREKNLLAACYGLFLITLALNARAGAFFTLPAVLIWIVWTFKIGRNAHRLFTAGILAIMLGFALNMCLARFLGSPQGIPFSNYSYTFYGLASGNNGWTQVMTDYPGVREDDVPRLALQKFKENPYRLLVGIGRSYGDYFQSSLGAFSFLKLVGSWSGASLAMWLLTATGLLVVGRFFKTPAFSLILACAAGIYLSVSLVPPIDADSMRAYAATIPMTACLVGMGASFPRHLAPGFWKPAAESIRVQEFATPASLVLLCLAWAIPMAIHVCGSSPLPDPRIPCETGRQPLTTIAGPGSFVNLIRDEDAAESLVPNIRVSDFKQNLNSGSPELDRELSRMRSGQAIGIASEAYVITDSGPLPSGRLVTCAKFAQNPWLHQFRFFLVDNPAPASGKPVSVVRYPRLARAVRALMFLGLVFLVTLSAGAQLNRLTHRENRRFIWCGIAMLLPGILVYAHSSAIFPLLWERVPVQTKLAVPEKGHCYLIPLGINWMSHASGFSPAQVFEGEHNLKFSNSLHEDIRNEGGGRFSVWEGTLYLSTSDNTDPRTNGRSYEVYWPKAIPFLVRIMIYALGTFGIMLLFLAWHKGARQ